MSGERDAALGRIEATTGRHPCRRCRAKAARDAVGQVEGLDTARMLGRTSTELAARDSEPARA